MILIGRDPQKSAPGVDFLLPEIRWVPKALERAQHNKLDFGFGLVPTLTAEDIIVAKLISSHAKAREQDILDLRSIFRNKSEIDLVYIIARMKDLDITVVKTIEEDVPTQILRASKRISRDIKRRIKK